MTKRVSSLVLVIILLCTMTISVSAASASKDGYTSGGTVGTAITSASINVYTEHVTAETWCAASQCMLRTTAILNRNGASPIIVTGTSYATACKTDDIHIPNTLNGSSEHSVNGGSAFGSWTTNLSANVW